MVERKFLAESIRLGAEQGLFECKSPEETAAFGSTHIDGICYSALACPGHRDNNVEAETGWPIITVNESPD